MPQGKNVLSVSRKAVLNVSRKAILIVMICYISSAHDQDGCAGGQTSQRGCVKTLYYPQLSVLVSFVHFIGLFRTVKTSTAWAETKKTAHIK